jgi:hypothetical protein
MTTPMLADFATRLACGLAGVLLLTPWRVVPPVYFRTQCQVMLGLLALAALDLGRGSAGGLAVGLAVASAALAFVGSAAWGLGLPRVGIPATAAVASATAALLVLAGRWDSAGLWALDAGGRLASALVLGSTLAAMLLGHHYLTAPAMSIEPLRRLVRVMALALGLRAALGAVGLAIWLGGGAHSRSGGGSPAFFLAMRWGMGLVVPAVATYMAARTAAIRSTQSATGILYIAMTLVLFGELTAMILARDAGVVF